MKRIDHATIYFSPRQDLYHASYLLSAFASLERNGTRIGIKFEPSVNPVVPQVRLDGILYAIDLHDSNGRYCLKSLAACDFYAKRSCYVPKIPPEFSHKVIPFGLNYGCRSNRSSFFLGRALAVHPGNLKSLVFGPYIHLPTPEQVEYPADRAAETTILFQTRVWPEDELGEGDTLEGVNGVRASLIRELRKAFGKRFQGGLIPTQFALKMFPDLVTASPHRRRDYAAFARKPAIAICSSGLHKSHPFKLAEYLASSKAIVGEPLVSQLPVPLDEGRNYISFQTVDACVAACEMLLSNPTRREEMRHASWNYYLENVRYDKRLQLLASLRN